MPTLFSPAALWALAGLALPLVLHLWRPPPRTLLLGSLRFLQSTARHPLRNLRWRERLLLCTRLTLLTLLVLCVAGLRWQRPPSTRPEHRVLLDPTAPLVGASFDRLHALQHAGYQTRFLSPVPDLWALLRECDATLPPGSRLAIFSPGRLASMRGLRPALSHCQVEWVQIPVSSTEAKPVPPGVSLVSAPLKIIICHDPDHAEDARYVQAALEAVAKATGRTLEVQAATSDPKILFHEQADWIIWLRPEPPPPTPALHTANLLCEATVGVTANLSEWIVPLAGVSHSAALSAPVRLWRRGPVPPGAPVWVDASGRPLLTRTREGPLMRWTFASRFHPEWTDLPHTAALPAFLCPLLLPATDTPFYADAFHDYRLADPTQFLPSTVLPNVAPEPGNARRMWDLRGPAWILAAAFFILERLLSARRVAAPVAPTTSQTAFSP